MIAAQSFLEHIIQPTQAVSMLYLQVFIWPFMIFLLCLVLDYSFIGQVNWVALLCAFSAFLPVPAVARPLPPPRPPVLPKTSSPAHS